MDLKECHLFWYNSYFGCDISETLHAEKKKAVLRWQRRCVWGCCPRSKQARVAQRSGAGPLAELKCAIVGSAFCSVMIDTLSLPVRALERDLPPINVASAANHPLSFGGYSVTGGFVCCCWGFFSLPRCLRFKNTTWLMQSLGCLTVILGEVTQDIGFLFDFLFLWCFLLSVSFIDIKLIPSDPNCACTAKCHQTLIFCFQTEGFELWSGPRGLLCSEHVPPHSARAAGASVLI